MTQLKIDVNVYYNAATTLIVGAGAFFAAFEKEWKSSLWECGSMCGSYEEARQWARSYDQRSQELLKLAEDTASAALNYARVIRTCGYNYAVAEHNATTGATGPGPGKPPAVPEAPGSCPTPLPSAGGPGQGLVADGLGLVEKIGITVPDGDTTKLQNAANAWAALAAAPDFAGFPDLLRRVAATFDGQATAPEVAFIGHDLEILAASAADSAAACSEMSSSCLEHRASLDELRSDLRNTLEELRDELIKELAITAGITIVASLVTFGAGAALGTARAAQLAAKFAAPLRSIISLWKARKLAKSVKTGTSLQQHAREMRRIKEIQTEFRAAERVPQALTKTDADAIADYTGSAHQPINGWLRNGKDYMPKEVQDRVVELDRALDKLPNYQGPVTRVTDVPSDVLATYRKGEDVTEHAFTSTTPAGVRAEREGAVEFRYFSQTGKDITPYSAPGSPEILFKSGTQFRVVERLEPDFGRERTIITLVEKTS